MGVKTGRHYCWKFALIVFHLPVYVMLLTFNYLSTNAAPKHVKEALYGNITVFGNRLDTNVTPSSWVFGTVWTTIFIWQGLHIIYSLASLFRKTSDGDYLYVQPANVGIFFYATFMMNNIIVTAWLLLYARVELVSALILLLFTAISLYICIGLVARSLNRAGSELERLRMVVDIWLTRILFLNGLALYATWATIATLINVYIVMHYKAGVSAEVCTYLVLGLLNAVILVYYNLEVLLFDRHLRYVLTPYLVLILAFSGIITKFYKSDNPQPYLYYVIGLLVLSGILGLVKIFLMVYKAIKYPITYNL